METTKRKPLTFLITLVPIVFASAQLSLTGRARVFATGQSPPSGARVEYGRSSRARPFPPTPEWQALGYFGPPDSKFRRQVSYPFLVAIPSTDLQL